MTTLSKFKSLSINSKVRALYENGTFVVAIRYYGYKINLYLFEGEYVEVFYNHKLDYIEKIEFMDRNSSRMKFYLDQIRIPQQGA